MADWKGIVLFMYTVLTLLYHSASQPYEYVGCYTNSWTRYFYPSNVSECFNQCLSQSFSYVGLSTELNYNTCHCGHYDTLGTADGNGCQFCNSQSSDTCGKWWNFKAVYKRVCEDRKWGRIPSEYHPSGRNLDCGHTCGNCQQGITCDDRTGECHEKQCNAGYLPPNCDHNIMDIRYMGCYVDYEGRAFGTYDDRWYSQAEQMKTIQGCINICINRNSKYAGLVNGKGCFCGNKYDKYGRGSGCTVPCQGNSSEICGGYYRASVYKAECPFGYWGKHQNVCSKRCGNCKDNDQCDIDNGNCPAGCAEDLRNSSSCDQNCQAGTFGEDCTGECHCASVTDCLHTDGYCNGSGCQDGWQGDYCQDRVTKPLPIYAIVLICIGTLVLISALTVIIACWIKKRKLHKEEAVENKAPVSEAKSQDNPSDDEYEEIAEPAVGDINDNVWKATEYEPHYDDSKAYETVKMDDVTPPAPSVYSSISH